MASSRACTSGAGSGPQRVASAQVHCQICNKTKVLPIPDVAPSANGLITLVVPPGRVCTHHFSVYIDTQGRQRGFQGIDGVMAGKTWERVKGLGTRLARGIVQAWHITRRWIKHFRARNRRKALQVIEDHIRALGETANSERPRAEQMASLFEEILSLSFSTAVQYQLAVPPHLTTSSIEKAKSANIPGLADYLEEQRGLLLQTLQFLEGSPSPGTK